MGYECHNGQLYLVIKGVPNIVCFRVYVDLVFSLFIVIFGCGILLDSPEHDMSDLTPRLRPWIIVTLVIFILRIPLAILIEIGNEAENQRMLWLGLVGQIITIGIFIILTILALLISYADLGLGALSILLAFSVSPIYLILIIGKRIKQIKINSDADTNTA